MGSPTQRMQKHPGQQNALVVKDLQLSNSTASLSLGGMQKKSWMSCHLPEPVVSPPGTDPTLKWSKSLNQPSRQASKSQSTNGVIQERLTTPSAPLARPSSVAPAKEASPHDGGAAGPDEADIPTSTTGDLSAQEAALSDDVCGINSLSRPSTLISTTGDPTALRLGPGAPRKRHADSVGEETQRACSVASSSDSVEGWQPRTSASGVPIQRSAGMPIAGIQKESFPHQPPSIWSSFGSAYRDMRVGNTESLSWTMAICEKQVRHRMSIRCAPMERDTIERPRLELLRDACRQWDIAYLMIHQIYCAIHVKGSNTPQLLLTDAQKDAFRVLEIALASNSELPDDAIVWFAHFPEPLSLSEHGAPGNHQVNMWLRSALDSIATLASNWQGLTLACRARRFPPLVGELLYGLKLLSRTLQQVHFRTILRQLVEPGVRFQQHEAIFSRNQQHYSSLERTGTNLQAGCHHDVHFMKEHQQVLASDMGRNGDQSSSKNYLLNRKTIQEPVLFTPASPSVPLIPNSVVAACRVPSSPLPVHDLPDHPRIRTPPSWDSTRPGLTREDGDRYATLLRHCQLGRNSATVLPSAQAKNNSSSSLHKSLSSRSLHSDFQTLLPSDGLHPIPHHNHFTPDHTCRPALQPIDPIPDRRTTADDDIRGYLKRRTAPALSSGPQLPVTWTAKRTRLSTDGYFCYIKRISWMGAALSSSLPYNKQNIEINAAEASATARDIISEPGLPASRLLCAGSLTHRLRCVKLKADQSLLTDVQWIAASHVWPPFISIHLNHKVLEIRRKSVLGRDLPLDITRKIRCGSNELIAVVSGLPPVNKDAFLVGFESIETTTKSQIRDGLSLLCADDAKQRILRKVGSSDPDIEILDPKVLLDLTDPFSATLFTLPVRGETCAHDQCFDFDNFMASRINTSQCTGEPHPPHDFRCPICKGDARPGKLVVDGFMNRIRDSLVDLGRTDVKAVTVDIEGNWTIKEVEDANGEKGDGDGKRRKENGARAFRNREIVECDEDCIPTTRNFKTALDAEVVDVIDLIDD